MLLLLVIRQGGGDIGCWRKTRNPDIRPLPFVGKSAITINVVLKLVLLFKEFSDETSTLAGQRDRWPLAGNEGDKMELKVSHEEGYVLAITVGTVDDDARELFRESLHPLVGQNGTNVVLDLSQSTSINSDGIGQLVSLVTHANTTGSRVVLAACSPFISEVLDRNKLNTFFEMADSVPVAIRRVLG